MGHTSFNGDTLTIATGSQSGKGNYSPQTVRTTYMASSAEDDDQYEYIYVAYITLRDGRRITAASKGLKAFRIRVKRK